MRPHSSVLLVGPWRQTFGGSASRDRPPLCIASLSSSSLLLTLSVGLSSLLSMPKSPVSRIILLLIFSLLNLTHVVHFCFPCCPVPGIEVLVIFDGHIRSPVPRLLPDPLESIRRRRIDFHAVLFAHCRSLSIMPLFSHETVDTCRAPTSSQDCRRRPIAVVKRVPISTCLAASMISLAPSRKRAELVAFR